jgi:hypothetical protein
MIATTILQHVPGSYFDRDHIVWEMCLDYQTESGSGHPQLEWMTLSP